MAIRGSIKGYLFRADIELYEKARALASLQHTSVQKLLTEGLQRIVEERLAAGGPGLRDAVRSMTEYRAGDLD